MTKLSPNIFIKAGVVLFGVEDETIQMANQIGLIFNSFEKYCMITSGREGIHSSKNSKHYYGLALDFRTRHLSKKTKQSIYEQTIIELPDWLPILESTHLHIQKRGS